MSWTLEKVRERLSCPHPSSCNYYEVVTEISAATQSNKLTLEKSCRNCDGRDHLMFEVGSYDISDHTEFEVGDTFVAEEKPDWFRRLREGEECRVTAIANHPHRAKKVVGLVGGISEAPYSTTIVEIDRFRDCVEEGTLTPVE